MAYYTNDLWKDFQSMFPEHTKTPLRVAVWGILMLIDLIIGGLVAFWCGFFETMSGKNGATMTTIVLAGVAIGLFVVETVIWKAILRIFH